MKLHLGVIDQPYAAPPTKKGKRPKVAGGQTTGDVAGWLEDRYHVMEVFYELHKDDIAKDLEDGLRGTLESLLMGAPPAVNAFGSAESAIDDRFRKFLDDREIEGLGIPGVPTKAALWGVNHRLKNPHQTRRQFRGYRRRKSRPSFIDTGLYQSSEKTWVD